MPSRPADPIAEVRRLRRTRPRRHRLIRRFRLQVLLLVGVLLAAMLLAQGAYLNHRKAEIIGDQMGERVLQISGGDWMVFVDKPISMWLLIIAALSLLLPLVKKVMQRAKS
ncbi:MAG: hypothetical protein ABR580_04725 [Halomonas sp.]